MASLLRHLVVCLLVVAGPVYMVFLAAGLFDPYRRWELMALLGVN